MAVERLLHRITHRNKSVYCGYDAMNAAKEFFTLEPEANAEYPLEWTSYIVPDNPMVTIEQEVVRRIPTP